MLNFSELEVTNIELFEKGLRYCSNPNHEGERVINLNNFYRRNSRIGSADFFSECKTCRSKYSIKNREKRIKDDSSFRISELNRHYKQRGYKIGGRNFTFEDYQRIFFEQNGHCAISDKSSFEEDWLAVDHDHKTGEVRGLLAPNINMAIGQFRDCPNMLEVAIKYLRN